MGTFDSVWKTIKNMLAPNGEITTQYHHSFSGTDIKTAIYFPPEALDLYAANLRGLTDYDLGTVGKFMSFGSLQTLSVSSARSVGTVRPLGKSMPSGHTFGHRTIAGTLIFAVIQQDVFANIAEISSQEIARYNEYFVDQLPPFDIIVTGTSEYPPYTSSRQLISGVKLVNTGTTYSINDIYTEASYTYVAQWASPFVPIAQWKEMTQRFYQNRYYREKYMVSSGIMGAMNDPRFTG